MSTRLYIESHEVELNEGVIMPITFSVDNIRDISKTESAFSKTITVPGTANNNKLFNFLFNPKAVQTGIDSGSNIGSNYDFKKKAAAYVMQDGTVTFRGYARLVDATITKGNATYNIQIVSELTSFSSAIADKRLEDLPDELTNVFEHTLTRDYIFDSWDNADSDPAGEGVILYPLIDYGITETVNGGNFYLSCFRPALFMKQYIDLIFAAAGYTYASDFLNSDYFKRMVFPHNSQPFEGKGYASKVRFCELFEDESSQAGYNTAIGGQHYPFECVVADESGNYSGHFYTAPITTNYDVTAVFPDLLFKFTSEVLFNGGNSRQRFWVVYEKHAPDFSSSQVVEQYKREFRNDEIFFSKAFTPSGGMYEYTSEEPITITAPTIPIALEAGEHLAVSVYLSCEQDYDHQIHLLGPFYNPGTTTVITSDANPPTLEIGISKSFENSLVQFQNFVPKDVKQRDFLSSIIRLFGLIIEPDKDRPKHFNIYQRENYFQNGVVKDWTKKVDYSQDFKVTPVPSLDSSLLNFSYKEDKDYWNDVYTSRYGKIYGDFTIDTKYEFNQNTKRVLESNIFSPTPVVQYASENFPCELTCEILTSEKNIFYSSGYSELEGTELPGGDGFRKAKEGVKIFYDGNVYEIVKVFNPFKFQVNTVVTGSDDGGFWAKFGIFTYLAENDKTIPCVYESKDGNVTRQPVRINPRILYYSGKKTCLSYVVQETPLLIDRDYTYPNPSDYAVEKTEYPVLSHLDDNSNPTADLLFDRPARVYFLGLNSYPHYYNADTNTYAEDFYNLYKGWRNAVNEIIDNEAKLVSCKLFLNAVDIANLSLADTIVIDGTYYRINKVIDYMPGANRSTAAELVRKPKQDYDKSPAPPPDAECLSYSAMNHAGLLSQTITYYDCDGVLVEHVIPPGDTYVFCALEGSLQHSGYIIVSPGDGECGEPLPDCIGYSLHNNSSIFGINVEYRNCENEEITVNVPASGNRLICALEGSIVAPIDIVVTESGFPCGF